LTEVLSNLTDTLVVKAVGEEKRGKKINWKEVSKKDRLINGLIGR
jgi:hypothetical protein